MAELQAGFSTFNRVFNFYYQSRITRSWDIRKTIYGHADSSQTSFHDFQLQKCHFSTFIHDFSTFIQHFQLLFDTCPTVAPWHSEIDYRPLERGHGRYRVPQLATATFFQLLFEIFQLLLSVFNFNSALAPQLLPDTLWLITDRSEGNCPV